MRRRAYLAAVGTAALAGCSNGGGGDGNDGQETDRTPLGASYDHFREVAIDAVEQGGLAETPLSATVAADSIRIDESSTARVTVTLENTGEEAVALEVEQCAPADRRVGTRTGGEKQLLLMRAGEYEGDRAAGAAEQCWRPSYLDIGGECRRVRRRLTPGDPWERTYWVWDDPNNGSCLPAGPYVFEPGFAIVDPRAETADDGTTSAGTSVATTEGTATEASAGTTGAQSSTTDGPEGPPLDSGWSFTVGIYEPGLLTETPTGE